MTKSQKSSGMDLRGGRWSSVVLCGFMVFYGVDYTIHLIWSRDPVQRCTYSGSIWSILFNAVLTADVSNLALLELRNREITWTWKTNLQVLGSLGLPRNERTVVPLFTCLFKLIGSQDKWMRSWWRKLSLKEMNGKYQSQVLRTGQLSQADPSMV